MAIANVDVKDQVPHKCVDDFDIQGLMKIYGESAHSFNGCLDFVGLEDFNGFAGKEISDIKGKIYPSKECCYFMTFPKEYIGLHCSRHEQWIEGLQYWVPVAADGFLEHVTEYGKQCTINNLAITALGRWYNMFSNDGNLLGSDFIALPMAMLHNINVRDAMLITILDENQEWYDEKTLVDFAFCPHTPEISRNLRHCLEAKFAQTTKKPDVSRAVHACKVLQAMALVTHSIPELTVQIYALLAYISWWFHLGDVQHYTHRALSIDPDCSMAKIVLGADEHHLEPAWCECYATPQNRKRE
ncbi:hypothetical protein [Gardnerella vaginalis]|nr:hypothetical protein [Gardnerella vaginalis]